MPCMSVPSQCDPRPAAFVATPVDQRSPRAKACIEEPIFSFSSPGAQDDLSESHFFYANPWSPKSPLGANPLISLSSDRLSYLPCSSHRPSYSLVVFETQI